MNIEIKFDHQKEDFNLNVDFKMPNKGISAIFGPSGCGKTTLMRLIAGLDYCKNGRCKIGDLIWQNESKFIYPYKRDLGYVFQEPSLFEHLNVLKNLEFALNRVKFTNSKLSLEYVIDLLGISDLLTRFDHGLSGGERQRVAMARAILSSPKILLMDEPLAALDMESKDEIFPFLYKIGSDLEIPILYVSHSIEEISRLADHLVLMDKGRIVAQDTVENLLTDLSQPLASTDRAAALVYGKVVGQDHNNYLSEIEFAGGVFQVPELSHEIGSKVRLRVLARDVSIALEYLSDSSILNIFQGEIIEIVGSGLAQKIIKVNVKEVIFISRITKKSSEKLNLFIGKSIFIQVKSITLLSN